MSYQFTLNSTPSPRQRRGHLVAFVALVAAIIAGYVFAACGDRTPEHADAKQPETPPAVTPETTSAGVTAPVSFEQADSAFRAGRYGDAANLFTAYTDRRPENPWGFYMLGLSTWRAGERDQAIAAFTKALEIDSTHVKSHLNLSRVLIESNRASEALPHIDQAIALDSTSSQGPRVLGRALEELGRVDEATAAFKRAILLDERDVWSMNNLGALFMKLDRPDEALGPLARAVELEKSVATFHNNLGMALERTGHFTAAVEAYRAALAVDSSYAKAQSNLSRVQGLQEDPTLGPIDLTVIAQHFVEDVQRWR